MFLKIENLTFSYSGAKENIVDLPSFKVDQGDIMGIIGKSGSGKSTLLRLIAGLDTPKSGKISLDRQIIFSDKINLPPEKRKIGMIFQDYGLFPHLTVEENISFGIHHWSKEERKKRIDEMLGLIQMTSFKKRYPYELSGGQQQRIAIARTLAPKPILLLMDEPFSNLDAQLKRDIREEVHQILKHEKTTTLFVSHDPADIEALCDQTNDSFNN